MNVLVIIADGMTFGAIYAAYLYVTIKFGPRWAAETKENENDRNQAN